MVFTLVCMRHMAMGGLLFLAKTPSSLIEGEKMRLEEVVNNLEKVSR